VEAAQAPSNKHAASPTIFLKKTRNSNTGRGSGEYARFLNYVNVTKYIAGKLDIFTREENNSLCFILAGFLFGLLFYPEDGGDTILRNVGSYKSHTASSPRR
jgi:hypothetical protein